MMTYTWSEATPHNTGCSQCPRFLFRENSLAANGRRRSVVNDLPDSGRPPVRNSTDKLGQVTLAGTVPQCQQRNKWSTGIDPKGPENETALVLLYHIETADIGSKLPRRRGRSKSKVIRAPRVFRFWQVAVSPSPTPISS